MHTTTFFRSVFERVRTEEEFLNAAEVLASLQDNDLFHLLVGSSNAEKMSTRAQNQLAELLLRYYDPTFLVQWAAEHMQQPRRPLHDTACAVLEGSVSHATVQTLEQIINLWRANVSFRHPGSEDILWKVADRLPASEIEAMMRSFIASFPQEDPSPHSLRKLWARRETLERLISENAWWDDLLTVVNTVLHTPQDIVHIVPALRNVLTEQPNWWVPITRQVGELVYSHIMTLPQDLLLDMLRSAFQNNSTLQDGLALLKHYLLTQAPSTRSNALQDFIDSLGSTTQSPAGDTPSTEPAEGDNE